MHKAALESNVERLYTQCDMTIHIDSGFRVQNSSIF